MTTPAGPPPSLISSGDGGARPTSGWRSRSDEWRRGYKRGYTVGTAAQRTRGVRVRDGSFEMRCPVCVLASGTTAYWPLTDEFWILRNLSACRACLLARKRRLEKERYWADPDVERRRGNEYYEANQRVILLKKRARYAEDPLPKLAAHRAWVEAHRDATRAYRRAYYAKNRAAILQREKLRRAGVKVVAA